MKFTQPDDTHFMACAGGPNYWTFIN